jgi:hypothetical protein
MVYLRAILDAILVLGCTKYLTCPILRVFFDKIGDFSFFKLIIHS